LTRSILKPSQRLVIEKQKTFRPVLKDVRNSIWSSFIGSCGAIRLMWGQQQTQTKQKGEREKRLSCCFHSFWIFVCVCVCVYLSIYLSIYLSVILE
jgi:hypothetical protein